MMRFIRAVLPPVIVFIVAIAAMQLAVRIFKISKFNLPPPTDVWRAMKVKRLDLLACTWSTAKAALIGFGLSAFLGVAAAVALSASRMIQRAFYPYTVFFQTVPIIAIAPLLVYWLGFGIKSVAAAAFIASVFPVIANTLTGLLSTDPALRDLFRLYRASRLSLMFKLKLPSALPNVFTGLRIAAGLSVIGAIVGEFVSGTLERNAGLGVAVLVAKRLGKTDEIFASVLAASLLGLAMLAMINLAAYLSLRRWHASEQSE
jgi:NitT/TauT family transport system permease protein